MNEKELGYVKLLESKGFSFHKTEPLDEDYYELSITDKHLIWKICKTLGIGYANPTEEKQLLLYCRASFTNSFISYGLSYREMDVEDFMQYVTQI